MHIHRMRGFLRAEDCPLMVLSGCWEARTAQIMRYISVKILCTLQRLDILDWSGNWNSSLLLSLINNQQSTPAGKFSCTPVSCHSWQLHDGLLNISYKLFNIAFVHTIAYTTSNLQTGKSLKATRCSAESRKGQGLWC